MLRIMFLSLPVRFVAQQQNDDQVRFTTYLHYIINTSEYLESEFGSGFAERYENIAAAMAVKTRSIHRKSLDATVERLAARYLRSALSNLMCLYQEANSADFFEAKNAWTPAQAWYAVHHAMCSLGSVMGNGGNPTHARSTREAAKLISDRDLMPAPWSVHIKSTFEDKRDSHEFIGFQRPPEPISSLTRPDVTTFEDHYAMMLTTTANRRAERTFTEERKKRVAPGRTRRNISANRKRELYEQLGPTTLFDVLYRMRLRANYGEVDTFVIGCSSPTEGKNFAAALTVIVDCTLAVLESILIKYWGANIYKVTLKDYASRHESREPIRSRLEYYDL